MSHIQCGVQSVKIINYRKNKGRSKIRSLYIVAIYAIMVTSKVSGELRMRKFAISFIAILLIGIGAFYGIKTWENQKNNLNSSQKSVQKVSHINLVALGDSLTEGVGDEKK